MHKKELTNFLEKSIFNITSPEDFQDKCLKIFQFQFENNLVYHEYCQHLKINPLSIDSIEKIPFLPVSFFKTKKVVSIEGPYEIIYTSSGTTGMENSSHYVKYNRIYHESFIRAFEISYGDISHYRVLALLPSYLERKGSSLIEMSEKLIGLSGDDRSGFYLYDVEKLFNTLSEIEKEGKKNILLGVTFALLDFSEKFNLHLKNTIVMETGGMKGKRKEMTRDEVHAVLKKGFGVDKIHSEYGMTELLSQSYSKGDGIYYPPPWKKIMIRDQYDPFTYVDIGSTGGINVIDLANIYSCSFIETMDLGRIHYDNGFEVLGRFDNSDIRGCNLMIG